MTVPERPPTAPSGESVLVVACREFVELATEHLEGTLSPQLQHAVAEHLELCDPCVEYLSQLEQTAGLLRRLPTETLPPAARNRLLEVYTRLHPAAGAPR